MKDDADDKMKTNLLRSRLLKDTKFTESIGLKATHDFNHLLERANKYIQCEEMLEANKVIYGTRDKKGIGMK